MENCKQLLTITSWPLTQKSQCNNEHIRQYFTTFINRQSPFITSTQNIIQSIIHYGYTYSVIFCTYITTQEHNNKHQSTNQTKIRITNPLFTLAPHPKLYNIHTLLFILFQHRILTFTTITPMTFFSNTLFISINIMGNTIIKDTKNSSANIYS